MILSDVVAGKFEQLLAAAASWKNLVGSQFVKHLACFVSWCLEDATFKVERALQENFVDSALNRSSILALGEGIEYMPRKPVPATGKATFANTGDAEFTLVRGREFMSDSQTIFTLEETLVVPAHSEVTGSISQRTLENITFTVSESMPFYEILLGRDVSPKVASFKVFVDEGAGEREWKYDRLLTNAYGDTLCFDEYYHFTDQIGIRFGNGEFGKIPAAGAQVRVETVQTDGDTILLEKQSLWPVEEIRDRNGQAGVCAATVSETVQHGEAQESTEEMRRNLHYAPVYNDRLVWDNDYTYFLGKRYPEIVWARAWGEEESEKMWGYKLEHINRIWICAYSPDRDIQEPAMKAIGDVSFLCRNFVWHEPEHVQFWLTITGQVLTDCVLSEVQAAISAGLEAAYGKASRTRREEVLLHEIYEIINNTGYFEQESGAWFEVLIEGQSTADKIYQMVSINLEQTTMNLTYKQ